MVSPCRHQGFLEVLRQRPDVGLVDDLGMVAGNGDDLKLPPNQLPPGVTNIGVEGGERPKSSPEIGCVAVKRRHVAEMYQQLLDDDDRLIIPQQPPDCRMAWFVFVVRLTTEYTLAQRDKILKTMRDRGIQVSNYFPPAYLQPFMTQKFGYKEGDFPITDSVCKSTIALPFHNNLTRPEVKIVCTELKNCLDSL